MTYFLNLCLLEVTRQAAQNNILNSLPIQDGKRQPTSPAHKPLVSELQHDSRPSMAITTNTSAVFDDEFHPYPPTPGLSLPDFDNESTGM